MTVDIRRPCDTSPECQHRLCHVCEKRIRLSDQLKNEHEGAVEGWVRDRLCLRCKIEGHKSIHDTPQPEPEPEPDVLKDERYMILQDHQMERMAHEHPSQYAWHIARRRKLSIPLPGNTPPLREDGLPVGVTRVGKKWKVQLTQQGRKNYYGIYETPEEATQVAIREYTKGQHQ